MIFKKIIKGEVLEFDIFSLKKRDKISLYRLVTKRINHLIYKKIQRVILNPKLRNVLKKLDTNAPHETFLILDATTGQSAINQVEEFRKISPITGIIMTKLDGAAKGGILLAISKKFKIPIIALGMGEKEDDLQIFKAQHFAKAIMTS